MKVIFLVVLLLASSSICRKFTKFTRNLEGTVDKTRVLDDFLENPKHLTALTDASERGM